MERKSVESFRFILATLLIALFSCVCSSQSSNNQPIAEVPFAFDHTSIVIQVKLNGKGPFNMILDTGRLFMDSWRFLERIFVGCSVRLALIIRSRCN